GTVQVYFGGTWSSLVHYNWEYHDARAACRQLGWETGAAVTSSGAVYGNPVGPVWPMGFNCGWEEERLMDCPRWNELSSPWITPTADDATTFNDTAGVICRNESAGEGALQLVGSDVMGHGTLQIFHSGRWGVMHSSYVDWRVARIACRELGWTTGDLVPAAGDVYGGAS
ncbi:hypothetical protein VOLCADRAFT_34806, partial [Volvox carteri f. nagariensis]